LPKFTSATMQSAVEASGRN